MFYFWLQVDGWYFCPWMLFLIPGRPIFGILMGEQYEMVWKCNIKNFEKILYLEKISQLKMWYKKFWENFVLGKKLLSRKCNIKNFKEILYQKNY